MSNLTCVRRPMTTVLCVVIAATTLAAKEPIRALLITGGCCHDYSNQKRILADGIASRIDIDWTIVEQGGSTKKIRERALREGMRVVEVPAVLRARRAGGSKMRVWRTVRAHLRLLRDLPVTAGGEKSKA